MVVPDQQLVVLGIVCIVIGVSFMSLLCCYSGTDITGHTIPPGFQKEWLNSLRESEKRAERYKNEEGIRVQNRGESGDGSLKNKHQHTLSLPIHMNQVQPSS